MGFVCIRALCQAYTARLMTATTLSLVFCVAVLGSLLVQFWLATRQMRHVAQHREHVPPAFSGTVTA